MDNIIEKLEEQFAPIIDFLHEKENYIFSKRNDKYCIDIRYPKKVVKNQYGEEHTIYDFILTLSLYVNNTVLCFYGLIGNRGALTKAEYDANYLFSHCSRSHSNATFCFGSGPLYQSVNNIMSVNDFLNPTEKDKKNFEKFLILFDSYLEWESIEGGPYIKMREIGTSKKTRYNIDNSVINRAKIFIKSVFDINDFTIRRISDLSYYVSINPSAVEKLYKGKIGLVIIQGNEEYIKDSNEDSNFSLSYNWGNENLVVKRIKENTEEKEVELVVSRQLIRILENNLTKSFNKYLHFNYLKSLL